MRRRLGRKHRRYRRMPTMQAQDTRNHRGPGSYYNAPIPRLLEDSDGVKLYHAEQVLAFLRDVRLYRCSSGPFVWLRWEAASLTWEHSTALLYLRGASIQQLLGPRYVPARLSVRPPYESPNLVDVVLLEPDKAVPGFSLAAFVATAFDTLG